MVAPLFEEEVKVRRKAESPLREVRERGMAGGDD
jgi:hypothetical protein